MDRMPLKAQPKPMAKAEPVQGERRGRPPLPPADGKPLTERETQQQEARRAAALALTRTVLANTPIGASFPELDDAREAGGEQEWLVMLAESLAAALDAPMLRAMLCAYKRSIQHARHEFAMNLQE